MLYFANPCGDAVTARMATGDLALIRTPGQGNKHVDGALWCADNGCYGKNYAGDDAWWAWLQRRAADHGPTCVFAVAPDVVGDAAATLERSLPWLPRIRSLGVPAAFVAQDGQEHLSVPWDTLDVLFVGGSTDWKLGPGARILIAEAKDRGKHVHMGRVNSLKRLRYAHGQGVDSVDGTFLTFGPDRRLPELMSWLHEIDDQTALEVSL